MLKYIMLLAILCGAGCQTTQPLFEGTPAQMSSRRSKKISVRVEKYVGSYDVEVQHAVQNDDSEEWDVLSAPRVSGYPEKWRHTLSAIPQDGYKVKASYLLGGEMIDISLEPGAHLIAKVLPLKQNTSRVIGIFSQTKKSKKGLEVFSVPFDISCGFGELTVVYLEDIDAGAVIAGAAE